MNQPACITRVTRLSILPPKEPIFSELCTHVSIQDEAAGEFIRIEQQSTSEDAQNQAVNISQDEWPAIREAVDGLMADILKYEETKLTK